MSSFYDEVQEKGIDLPDFLQPIRKRYGALSARAGRLKRPTDRIKLGKLGLDRGQAGIGSGDLKDARTFQQLSKARAGWNGRQIVGDQIGHIILTFAAVLSRLLSELSVDHR